MAFTWKRSRSLFVSVSSAIAVKTASTGPTPSAVVLLLGSVDRELDRRGGLREGAREDAQLFQREALVGLQHRIGDERLDVLVVDRLLLVREILEALEGALELGVRQLEAELAQPLAEGVAPGVLAHHELVRWAGRSTAAS